MVWAAFCFNRQVSLTFLDGRPTAQAYVQALEDNRLTFKVLLAARQWVFDQDNAQIRKVRIT